MCFLYYLSKKKIKKKNLLCFAVSWTEHVNTTLKMIILYLKIHKKQVFKGIMTAQ